MSNEGGHGVLPPALLRVAPELESVRSARHFLRELLRSADRERWADSAELALSEIVTNGILHAHTPLSIRVDVAVDEVRVEVSDGNPALPIQRRAVDPEATTGRGLELVAALVRACGVRPEPAGKVVWFTVGDEELDQPGEADLLAAWQDLDAEPADPYGVPDVTTVVLQRMPTALWTAARAHHHAMLRELVLYVAEHDDLAPVLPDVALADRARHLIWTALLAELDRTGAPDAVDLPVAVPAGLGPGFSALQDALDVGERLAVRGRLLVRPALPEIVAVRDWACEQVVAQLAGVPGAPWPGADQPHFLDLASDRVDSGDHDWDRSVVTESARGLVAADDANRILAVSRSLARLVGWEPAELVGRRVAALVPPELREAHVAGFSRHVTTGEAHILGRTLELPVLHRDGTTVPCTFTVERQDLGNGRPVYLASIEPRSG